MLPIRPWASLVVPGLMLGATTGATAAEATLASPATASGPDQVVADLAAQLFALLAGRPASLPADRARVLRLLDSLLAPRFDADYAAHRVLGQRWTDATAAQQQKFAGAFYQSLLRTYAGAVAKWTPERFKLLPRPVDAAALQALVHTQVASVGGAITAVDYRLRLTGEGWKMFDVIVDGVSYVRSLHDDLSADVAQNGLDAATLRLLRREAGPE